MSRARRPRTQGGRLRAWVGGWVDGCGGGVGDEGKPMIACIQSGHVVVAPYTVDCSHGS